MSNKISSKIKPLLKSLFVFGLIFTLVMSSASSAIAARTGGRMGGGSFRAPSRSYSPSGGGYRSGGGYGYGGGFGFPFLLPFFGFGGGFGGLFSILIFIALANFLVRSFRGVTDSGTQNPYGYSNPKVSVGRLQVGLISNARGLQKELNELGRTADTDSAAGRAQLLQESTLALLRHPEYWVYGATESQQTALEAAEAKFNQISLAERSKFTEETLSNFNNQRRFDTSKVTQSDSNTELAVTEASSGYIVVTIVVGIEGKLELPKINSSEELNQALRQIGGVASERLLAVEVLWTPQAEGDTLTSDDIMAGYPDLKLV